MALVIRGIDDEAKGAIIGAFSFEGFLGLDGYTYWGISDKAEDFLKEKGVAFDVTFEHGAKILTVKEWIEDEILDELDEIAEEREKDPLERKSHNAVRILPRIEEYVQFYGEDFE